MLFSEAIEKFIGWNKFTTKPLSSRGYYFDLRAFCLYLRNPLVENIELDHVLEYFRGMQQLNWEPNTLSRKGVALRKFFKFMKKLGARVIDHELIPQVQHEVKIARVADEPTYLKLIATQQSKTDPRQVRNLALLNLLWDTGMRNGELLSLNISDIDFENKKALIRTEKAKTIRPFREVFWTTQTNKNLKEWLMVRDRTLTEYRFSRDCDPNAIFVALAATGGGHRLTTSGLALLLRRLCHRAHLPVLNAHSFRHHMGHYIIKQGGTNSDVSNILGHARLESSFVYTQLHNKELGERYKHFMGD